MKVMSNRIVQNMGLYRQCFLKEEFIFLVITLLAV